MRTSAKCVVAGVVVCWVRCGCVDGVGWWCTPAAVVLAARLAATVVVLAVESRVAVCELVVAMVVCGALMEILVAAPRLVGVMVSTIR